MGYSLTNTTKKKSGGSSGSSSTKGSKGGMTVTVTKSDRGSSSSSSSGSSGSGGIKYDPNKDYAAEIQKAVQSGASQDYINSLNAQRDAKIKGEKLSYSSLTDSDIANYKNTSSVNRNNYVIGQDGGSDKYTYNPDDEYIKNLSQSLDYDPNHLRGYADPTGYYTTRQNAFVWEMPDGTKKTTYSNATNYNQALKDAISAGQLTDGAKLLREDTYGTSSLTGDSYNYGVTAGTGNKSGFGDGYEGGRYTSDKQYAHNYDMNNMQLEFLSGRDNMNYKNKYSDLAYSGNGMTNAYDKGTQFAGQGGIMGDYGVEGPNMDDIYANYGTTNSGYVGLTKDDIESQMNDAYEGYMDAVNERNDALAAAYASQIEQLKQAAEEEQRANYINYKLAGLNMPAQMQAAGINGGIAESTLAGLESDYMKNYNSTAGTLTNAINQLNIAQNNAIAEGNMEAANMYAQMQQNSLSLQMQAAQAENAYNQWVQEMAFARNQWEYEQARYNAEMAAREQQEAEDRALSELKYMAELGIKVGDTSYLQSMGFDTSYLDRYNDLTLQEKQASLLKKKASGRSSGGYNPIDEELDEKINGTPHSNAVTNYIDNTIKKSGIGAMAVGGYNQPLTGNQIKQYLTNGWLLADITGDKITIGSPAYFEALNR